VSDRLSGLVVQSSWLQSHRPGFTTRRYQIFRELVDMEPLSLVGTTEELHGRKSSCSGLENRDYGSGGSATDYATPLYPQKLPLTSSIRGGHSVGIVRSRTQATEFVCLFVCLLFVTCELSTMNCKLQCCYELFISAPRHQRWKFMETEGMYVYECMGVRRHLYVYAHY
jgi:hypothetical protein